ncbi:MAG: FAD-dependent oxidoreductase [Verrucomicrobia bacterium]|nr:FAD-dependent oxidoreductase [Verrucomicrobiota bacterium]
MARRVLIIGGGVIGLCSAYYAATAGHRVTLVERGAPDHDTCAHGSAGMITPSHFVPLAAPGMVALGLKWMWNPESPFYIKPRLDRELLSWGWKFFRAANAAHVDRAAPVLAELNLASRALFEELADTSLADFGLVRRGLLMLCKSPAVLDEEAHFADRANRVGVPAEVLDAKQAAALDPDARMDVAGAIYFPKDCHLDPRRFMAALQAKCEQLGVQFRWNSDVTGFASHAQDATPRLAAARTSTGDIEADEFVLAGGSWSPQLARPLGLRLPMLPGKGYSLTLPRPRQLPQLCSILTEARVAVTPMGSSLRFGGTMEIGGLDHDINPLRVRGIIKSARRYFPDFTESDFESVQPWCGLRPVSPDGLPYLGRTAKCPNLTIATGHAMTGLSLGPVTGRLVGELLDGKQPSMDLSLLSPDRFAA